MCKCGCRGWCSIYPLLHAWALDLQQLQESNRCAVLDITCDWPAYLEITGLRFWNHADHPCCLCRLKLDELNADKLTEATLDNLPHELYSMTDYWNDIGEYTKVS